MRLLEDENTAEKIVAQQALDIDALKVVLSKSGRPEAEREAVRAAREGQLGERRACGLIGMNRGSWRYQRKGGTGGLACSTAGVGRRATTLGYRRCRMLRREKKTEPNGW
jgi:hypothetical protein